MPRAKNPIADLKSLDDKAQQLAARRACILAEAEAFVGKLAFEAGLGDWDTNDLKAGFKDLVARGPVSAKKAGKPKLASPEKDADASPSVAAE